MDMAMTNRTDGVALILITLAIIGGCHESVPTLRVQSERSPTAEVSLVPQIIQSLFAKMLFRFIKKIITTRTFTVVIS